MEIVLENQTARAIISPIGAQLLSFFYDRREWIWQRNNEIWNESSPLLFPFIGRLYKKQYKIEGCVYSMDIHGFAKRMMFMIQEQTKESVTLLLEFTKETLKEYPFMFSLKVTYHLMANGLQIIYNVVNTGKKTMYYAVGGHTGFQVPFDGISSFEDYYLDFSKVCTPKRVGHTKHCLLDGTFTYFPLKEERFLPLSHTLFDEDAIVLQQMEKKVAIKGKYSRYAIEVFFDDMDYLGIWQRPFSKAKYLCIEPWTSLPGRDTIVEDFSNKPDMISLLPGMEDTKKWQFYISTES